LVCDSAAKLPSVIVATQAAPELDQRRGRASVPRLARRDAEVEEAEQHREARRLRADGEERGHRDRRALYTSGAHMWNGTDEIL
jgi:hypothetical protein